MQHECDTHPTHQPRRRIIVRHCMTAALLLWAAGCASTREAGRQEHDHAASHPTSPSTHSGLVVPQAIEIEHTHLHRQLEAAIASGGKTGLRANEVAAILHRHFKAEEAYAMPPLGLLELLARNEPLDDAQVAEAIRMADHLRREYNKVLGEHEVLTEALHQLASAANEEGKPNHAAFADALIMHAQNEEQVLYPATLVIGEYLKLQQAARRSQ